MKILRPEEMTELPEIRDLTPEEQTEVLRLAKAAFTADDLQKFTELDEGVSMESVLAELEQTQKEFEPGGVHDA